LNWLCKSIKWEKGAERFLHNREEIAERKKKVVQKLKDQKIKTREKCKKYRKGGGGLPMKREKIAKQILKKATSD